MRWLVLTMILVNIVFYFWRTDFWSINVADGGERAAMARQDRPYKEIALLRESRILTVEGDYFVNDFGPISEQTGALILKQGNLKQGGLKQAKEQQTTYKNTCLRLGPFSRHQTAEIMVKDLLTFDFAVVLENRPQQISRKYLVYTPLSGSAESAKRIQRELQSLGFESFEFEHDKLKSALSLGYFNVEDNAKARLNELISRGHDAKIDIIIKDVDIYWVIIAERSVARLSTGFWTDLARSNPQINAYTGRCS